MKKIKIIAQIFFIIQILTINILCQAWEVQKTNTKASIRSICFLDSLNGWAITDSIIFLHTTNGGNNWLVEKIKNEEYGIQQIQFINKNIGYACASQGRLFSTKNGGATWARFTGKFEIDFQDLFFVNENEGWAVGERWGENLGRGMIVHTSDGGTSWHTQLEMESTNRLEMKFFKAIRMKNNNEGWAIAGDYFDNYSPTNVYKTINGGKSWVKLSSVISRAARRMKIANNDTIWTDGYGASPMSTTTDGGISWNMYPNEYKYIAAISPQTGNKGWAFFYNYPENVTSSIVYTSNRGISWGRELLVKGIVDIENKGNFLWIVGNNGLIMRKRLTPTSIVDRLNTVCDRFELFGNYPNPFNPKTTIEFSLPREGKYVIGVYSIHGESVKELANREFKAGYHKVSFDGSSFSSGVYFYSLRGEGVNMVKKMMLIK